MLREVTADNMDDIFDQMVDAQAEQLKKEQSKDVAEEKRSATDTLIKFRKYINSMKFDMKCRKKAKEYGYDYKIFKRGIVKTILQKIADIFGLTVCVIGDVLTYAVEFLSNIITRVIDFTVGICKKIVNLLTFNCGSIIG